MIITSKRPEYRRQLRRLRKFAHVQRMSKSALAQHEATLRTNYEEAKAHG